jgi:hypothetical protein
MAHVSTPDTRPVVAPEPLTLYEYQRVWRVIWTDGRDLPKDPDTSLYGYSVGTWVDDNTFVVQEFLELSVEPAVGLEPTTPIFGRPTSVILDKPSLGKSPNPATLTTNSAALFTETGFGIRDSGFGTVGVRIPNPDP